MTTFDASPFLAALWRQSLWAAFVVALVLVARTVFFRGSLTRWRSMLWAIVLLRLVLPSLPTSRFSALNFARLLERPNTRTSQGVPPEQTAIVGKTVITRGYLPPFEAAARVTPLEILTRETPSHAPRLLWIWLAGFIAVVAGRGISHARFLRRLARQSTEPSRELLQTLGEACDRMGIGKTPRLRMTDAVPAPALVGLLRPQLLLPPTVVDSLSSSQLRLVMLHELAHLRRADLWVDAACTPVIALHWFNPAVWLAAALYRSDREVARDAMVIEAAGESEANAYGRAMVTLLERAMFIGRMPTTVVGMLERWGGLRRRVQSVAEFRKPRTVSTLLAIAVFLAVAFSALTNRQTAAANPPTTDAANKSASEPKAPDTKPTSRPVEAPFLLPPPTPTEYPDLQKKLPTAIFAGNAFGDVIDFLRDASKTSIFVNWRSVGKAGVTQKTPVTVSLKNAPLSKVLHAILEDVSNGPEKLAYVIDEGVISIGTARDLRPPAGTKTYDIRDILVEIPDFDNPPVLGMARPKTAAAAQPPERPFTREERVHEIVKFIKETIDPNSWSDFGRINELADQLIVTQTPENQEAIANLFEKLRETRGITILLDARLFEIDSAADERDPTIARVLKFITVHAPGGAPDCYLDDAQADVLITALHARHDVRELHAPRIELYNGQRGYVMASTVEGYLASYKLVKDDAGKTQYEPQMSQLSSGVLFDAQATCSSDRKYVTMTLRPQVSRLNKLQWVDFDADAPLLPDGRRPRVQRPSVSTSGIQTTVSIPDKGTLILGGFTPLAKADPEKGRGRDADKDESKTPRVFLMVRPQVILRTPHQPPILEKPLQDAEVNR